MIILLNKFLFLILLNLIILINCHEDQDDSLRNLKNMGKGFTNLNDYYVPENYNYYSGSFSEKYCKDAKYITIPLGTTGGLNEGSLSSFLLTKKGSNTFIALDAGTIWQGVRRLTTMNQFNNYFGIEYPEWAILPEQRATWFIKNHIYGYFIGHSHIDHVGGLIIESPEDTLKKDMLNSTIKTGLLGLIDKMQLEKKNYVFPNSVLQMKTIVGLTNTIQSIKDDLFNGKVWPTLPLFGFFDYYVVEPRREYAFSSLSAYNTSILAPVINEFPYNLKVTPYDICHDTLISTAFVFTDSLTGDQIVFFSDTGVPSPSNFQATCDWENKIFDVWRTIKIDKLKAVYIESSFLDDAADTVMFGHLRPRDIMKLMDQLLIQSIQTSPPMKNLKHVKLIIEHIKPQVSKSDYGLTAQRLVYNQLMKANTNSIKIIIPNQGDPICI
ncbi:cyclic nucleotide phosphodiesterase type II [Dictyostelium purpureum]|uniref:Cyclic nucleotide phosphodiesterase type II n=1 Tax=Dictyostelium purpureum TaxID=5786 RepID=F0ZQ35_DICPU|nr:cyclic nucleotide phosphodiesterase type II [Dictyostelium purpureum]EGC33941.1 cyclic nucleotide phosphodiesterase type II [Dictyostelium purpureum]|eukprot:XP_003289523.1 cyclic nucleotide phosphodiesterase type II [Dictyostelium purpureum]